MFDGEAISLPEMIDLRSPFRAYMAIEMHDRQHTVGANVCPLHTTQIYSRQMNLLIKVADVIVIDASNRPGAPVGK